MKKELVVNVMQSPRIATAVSTSTIAAGFGEMFRVIPWGDVAAAIGSVLSLVMIAVQIWKFILDRRRMILEIKDLERRYAAE